MRGGRVSGRYRVSDTVKLAAFTFIRKSEALTGSPPSGLLFNKFMIMFNRRMLKQGKDIRLAHCWYRWGDEVVSYALRDIVRFNHEELLYTSVSWIGKPIDDPEKYGSFDGVSAYADEFLGAYADKEGKEILLDDVYREAPYQFQSDYKKVRENLREALSNIPVHGYRTKILWPLFEGAMGSFPHDFDRISPYKEDFCKVFRAAIESDADIRELYCMSEDFWFFFCYHLRLKCHYNVNAETLSHWRDVLPWETERISWNIQDLAYKYLRDSDDGSIKRILSERAKRIEESDRFIDSISDEEMDRLRVMVGKDGNEQRGISS